MNKSFLLFLLPFALFCSFKNAQAETKKSLPKNAIPIAYRNTGIFIPAKINDSIAGNFLFDTGADRLSFDIIFYNDNIFLQSLNVRYGRVGGVGTGGSQSVPFITDSLDFNFGDHVYRTADIYVHNKKSGRGDIVDGMIGHRYFSERNYIIEISYADEYMIVHNDASTVDFSGYVKINKKKYELSNGARGTKFHVPVIIRVNDTLTIEDDFMFDTGSGSAILISTATAEKYNLSALTTSKVRAVANSAGVSGQTTSVYFTANSVEIGGHKLSNVDLTYSEDRSGSLASAHTAGGLLGNRILQNFDMVIDFGDSSALYLKPNRNFGTPFEDLSVYRGFGYADRSQTLKGWIVRGFFEGTPAEKSGMRSGDKIILVNGISVLEIPYEKQHDFWKNLDKVELVVLRNNEELKFEFELNPI